MSEFTSALLASHLESSYPKLLNCLFKDDQAQSRCGQVGVRMTAMPSDPASFFRTVPPLQANSAILHVQIFSAEKQETCTLYLLLRDGIETTVNFPINYYQTWTRPSSVTLCQVKTSSKGNSELSAIEKIHYTDVRNKIKRAAPNYIFDRQVMDESTLVMTVFLLAVATIEHLQSIKFMHIPEKALNFIYPVSPSSATDNFKTVFTNFIKTQHFE